MSGTLRALAATLSQVGAALGRHHALAGVFLAGLGMGVTGAALRESAQTPRLVTIETALDQAVALREGATTAATPGVANLSAVDRALLSSTALYPASQPPQILFDLRARLVATAAARLVAQQRLAEFEMLESAVDKVEDAVWVAAFDARRASLQNFARQHAQLSDAVSAAQAAGHAEELTSAFRAAERELFVDTDASTPLRFVAPAINRQAAELLGAKPRPRLVTMGDVAVDALALAEATRQGLRQRMG